MPVEQEDVLKVCSKSVTSSPRNHFSGNSKCTLPKSQNKMEERRRESKAIVDWM